MASYDTHASYDTSVLHMMQMHHMMPVHHRYMMLMHHMMPIFTFKRWESVRTLREDLGYPALSDIFAKARSKFQASLPRHHNSTISRLCYLTQADT